MDTCNTNHRSCYDTASPQGRRQAPILRFDANGAPTLGTRTRHPPASSSSRGMPDLSRTHALRQRHLDPDQDGPAVILDKAAHPRHRRHPGARGRAAEALVSNLPNAVNAEGRTAASTVSGVVHSPKVHAAAIIRVACIKSPVFDSFSAIAVSVCARD